MSFGVKHLWRGNLVTAPKGHAVILAQVMHYPDQVINQPDKFKCPGTFQQTPVKIAHFVTVHICN